jgi:hypothetical protein
MLDMTHPNSDIDPAAAATWLRIAAMELDELSTLAPEHHEAALNIARGAMRNASGYLCEHSHADGNGTCGDCGRPVRWAVAP